MCLVNLSVRLPSGQPASFASVAVYQVNRVLWWEIDSYVAAKTADYYGNVSFGLVQGRKYHFVFRHVARRGDLWRTIEYCPYRIYATFPY